MCCMLLMAVNDFKDSKGQVCVAEKIMQNLRLNFFY